GKRSNRGSGFGTPAEAQGAWHSVSGGRAILGAMACRGGAEDRSLRCGRRRRFERPGQANESSNATFNQTRRSRKDRSRRYRRDVVAVRGFQSFLGDAGG